MTLDKKIKVAAIKPENLTVVLSVLDATKRCAEAERVGKERTSTRTMEWRNEMSLNAHRLNRRIARMGGETFVRRIREHDSDLIRAFCIRSLTILVLGHGQRKLTCMRMVFAMHAFPILHSQAHLTKHQQQQKLKTPLSILSVCWPNWSARTQTVVQSSCKRCVSSCFSSSVRLSSRAARRNAASAAEPMFGLQSCSLSSRC